MDILSLRKEIERRKTKRACALTVICGSDAALHHADLAALIAQKFFGARRYNLIADPQLDRSAKHGIDRTLLLEDALATIHEHGADKLLIIGDESYVHELHAQTILHPMFRSRGFEASMAICHPKAAAMPATCVITCTDWQLHGSEGGVLREVRRCTDTLDVDDLALMTVPGVARELVPGYSRLMRVIARLRTLQNRGLRRVILLGHTNCAMRGGSATPKNADAESRAIAADLEGTASMLMGSVPDLEISTAIARTDHDRIRNVYLITRMFSRLH